MDTGVGGCDVVIALIGRQWLNAADESGGRRLDAPNDFVRLELEHPLSRGIRVITNTTRSRAIVRSGRSA
jgi:hypothetical protein